MVAQFGLPAAHLKVRMEALQLVKELREHKRMYRTRSRSLVERIAEMNAGRKRARIYLLDDDLCHLCPQLIPLISTCTRLGDDVAGVIAGFLWDPHWVNYWGGVEFYQEGRYDVAHTQLANYSHEDLIGDHFLTHYKEYQA